MSPPEDVMASVFFSLREPTLAPMATSAHVLPDAGVQANDSKSAVVVVEPLCDVMARPSSGVAAKLANVTGAPTCVQVTRSLDPEPVNVFPARTNRSHRGTLLPATTAEAVVPPVVRRSVMVAPEVGVIASRTMVAFAAVLSRNISPALANGSVFTRLFTLTIAVPSPAMGKYAKKNWSDVPRMPAP